MFWNHDEAQTEGSYLPEAGRAGVLTRQFTRARSTDFVIVQYQPGLQLRQPGGHCMALCWIAIATTVHFDNVRG